MNKTAQQRLRDLGLRLTKPRRAIIEALDGFGYPAPVEEIRQRMGAKAPDLATVYRNLDTLFEAGLAHKVDLGEGFMRWEPARDREHHHLVCSRCGKVECIDFCSIGPMIRKAAAERGFIVEGHRVELRGRCSRCRKVKGG